MWQKKNQFKKKKIGTPYIVLYTLIWCTTTPVSQISLHFTLWSAIPKILAIFHFSFGHYVKFLSVFKK